MFKIYKKTEESKNKSFDISFKLILNFIITPFFSITFFLSILLIWKYEGRISKLKLVE